MDVPAQSTLAATPPAIADLIARQPDGFSLAQEFYTSPEVYERDLQRIFFRHWQLAGHESLVPRPGDYFLYEVGRESVIIVRGRDQQLRAFMNVCRHRGSHICLKQQGHASVLVCPYHAWSYNLDGTLRAARNMGDDFDKTAYGLHPIHLEVAQGLVYLNFDERPISFERVRECVDGAHGPYGWGQAKVAHRETYTIDANWKLAVENYVECYHCGPAHPEYSQTHALHLGLDQIQHLNAAAEARARAMGVETRAFRDHWVTGDSGHETIYSHRYALNEGVDTASQDGRAVAPLMGQFTAFDGAVASTFTGPTNFMVAYPDHGVLYRFMPRDIQKTDMELVWLVRGDAVEGRDYDLERLTWMWRVTTDADKRITEDNQKGVNSRYYRPGPIAPMESNLVRQLRWYLAEIA